MIKHIYWKKLARPSSYEHCRIESNEDHWLVKGTVVGEDVAPFHVAYTLQLCPAWHVRSCLIEAQVGPKWHRLSLRRCADGAWFQNGVLLENTSDCTDIDISVTPFTNSLPVNRLKLKEDEEAEIRVLYIDVLERTVYASSQSYARITSSRYLFQSKEEHFEAAIDFDSGNWVEHYHGLFQRVGVSDGRLERQVQAG